MATAALDALTRAAIRAGSDKFGGHLYTPVYHELFAARREQPLKLFEIGIGGYEVERAGGLSLQMWAEYFPNATILGLDIHKKTLGLQPRIKVVQGSQTDRDLLTWLANHYGPFDIVIDDGSHVVEHQLSSFRTLYPLMAPDGIYAVEDTQTSFLPDYGGRPDGTETVFTLAHAVGLLMHRLEGYRDEGIDPFLQGVAAYTKAVSVYRNIVAFHRGANTYPSNFGLDLSDAEVRSVFDQIAEQEIRDPSPTAVLSRVDMLIWGGRGQEAATLAMAAADQNPRERQLLFGLSRMMGWAGQSTALAHIQALVACLD